MQTLAPAYYASAVKNTTNYRYYLVRASPHGCWVSGSHGRKAAVVSVAGLRVPSLLPTGRARRVFKPNRLYKPACLTPRNICVLRLLEVDSQCLIELGDKLVPTPKKQLLYGSTPAGIEARAEPAIPTAMTGGGRPGFRCAVRTGQVPVRYKTAVNSYTKFQ